MKRLLRSKNRVLSGVCAGLAEYMSSEDFNVDPTLVRLIWAVLALAGGFGILAYLVCWLVIPKAV